MNFYLDKNLILESNCGLREAEFAIIGVPFDSTCSYRPGCRFGPLWIRKEFLEIDKPESYFGKKVCDLGNVSVVHGNLEETNRRVEETVQGIIQENPKAVIITLGGEHSVSYSPIKVLAEKHKNLQVVHFDAHPDLMDDYLGEKWSHATVMKRVMELGGKTSVDIVPFGVRAGTDDEKTLMEKLPKKLDPKKPTYVSIDMDVFDPGICPGVGTPEPGGMAFKEVMSVLSSIKNIVGFDIVETNPLFDAGDITSVTAAKVMLQLILSK